MKIQNINIENGKVYKASICSRCGEVFLAKYIGEKETDGGYTRWADFEKEPEGWKDYFDIGLLCPCCNEEYKYWLDVFMKNTDTKNGE